MNRRSGGEPTPGEKLPKSPRAKRDASRSARRGEGFKLASMDPAAISPVFDLSAAIRDSREAYDKKDTDVIKWLKLHRVPRYVAANLERVIAGEGFSQEEARWCCIQFGVGQFISSNRFQAWKQLRDLAISKTTRYQCDGDWDDVQERLNNFPFKPRDCHSGTYAISTRIPEEIKIQVQGAASVIGMPASTLATICVIDALRNLNGVMHQSDMDSTMSEFFTLFERRTRRLRNLLVEIEILSPGQAP
jgi:hypothetical protein